MQNQKLSELPTEVLINIFSFIDKPNHLINASLTCKLFKNIIYSCEEIWKNIYKNYWGNSSSFFLNKRENLTFRELFTLNEKTFQDFIEILNLPKEECTKPSSSSVLSFLRNLTTTAPSVNIDSQNPKSIENEAKMNQSRLLEMVLYDTTNTSKNRFLSLSNINDFFSPHFLQKNYLQIQTLLTFGDYNLFNLNTRLYSDNLFENPLKTPYIAGMLSWIFVRQTIPNISCEKFNFPITAQQLIGEWQGFYFYRQGGTDGPMKINFECDNNLNVNSLGQDAIAKFDLTGTIDPLTNNVNFRKVYKPGPQWDYNGYLHRFGISGTWGESNWGGCWLIWKIK
eukprot:TRINITY_DN885_c1_g1_i1.p1 TRINITY_DN885_c1_g1~~TRINITY_DN885_c1_g1_i1.p1  ORF type:complete len:339 (-),score=104.76 TRINITY_DN885_c1_g1_i1:99-1115(-)